MSTPPTAQVGLVRPPVDANPPPKARFRESADNISKHRALVESREYQRAWDFGMLQYLRQLSLEVKDTNSALAAGYKLVAAFEIQRTINSLSELPKTTIQMPNDNLLQ